jgi:hypothetical protein
MAGSQSFKNIKDIETIIQISDYLLVMNFQNINILKTYRLFKLVFAIEIGIVGT